MKPFSLLVKPASADCNLACEYCFYLGKSALYPRTPRHRMTDDVLERIVASYMATEQPQYVFGWQGGEPTLAGVEFFRKVTTLQRKYGRAGAIVANGLQTNATLIDDELAAHLAEYGFLVGISLDGPAGVHDRYRTTAAGRGSHTDVMRGIDRLRRAGVEFNILTLVTAANVELGAEVYHYLRDSGFLFHQYIPCVEFDGDGRLAPFAITGEEWGEFLCAVFDEWAASDTRRVSVRLFDSILARLAYGVANDCTLARDCCQYFLVEHNGDMYPCDFFVTPELKLGNVATHSWRELKGLRAYRQFGARKLQTHPSCAACEYFELCVGDCLRLRPRDAAGTVSPSWLCAGWKRFYAHAFASLRSLAMNVAK